MDNVALAERYAQVKASIPNGVELIAVSKTRTVEEIQALYDHGSAGIRRELSAGTPGQAALATG